MVLSQPDIRKEVEAGGLKFDPPLEDRQWGEASVDLRLGFDFTKLQPASGMTFSVAGGLGMIGKSSLYSRRSCEYPEMTGMPREAAPCQFDDEWDRPDPDAQRDDRIDREMSHD